MTPMTRGSGHSFFRGMVFVPLGTVMAACLCAAWGVLANAEPVGLGKTAEKEEAAAIIAQMEAMNWPVGDAPERAAQRQRLGEASKRLLALGDDAREQIEIRLEDRNNPLFRRDLTYVLGEMPGEAVDRTLMRLLCCDKSSAVGQMALVQLLHRSEKQGPFTFTVPEEQLSMLIEAVRKADTGRAGELMRILALCDKNAVDTRFNPIIERFLSEIHFTGEFGKIKDSYLSPRVYMLNQYLLAFAHMGNTVWEPLRKAVQKARDTKDAEAEKWLCIGSGYACDPTMADYLKGVVLDEPDRYVRCVAIRAYAASAGKAAIPVLSTLVDDKTPSDYYISSTNDPYYIIGWTAQEGIATCEHGAPWSRCRH